MKTPSPEKEYEFHCPSCNDFEKGFDEGIKQGKAQALKGVYVKDIMKIAKQEGIKQGKAQAEKDIDNELKRKYQKGYEDGENSLHNKSRKICYEEGQKSEQENELKWLDSQIKTLLAEIDICKKCDTSTADQSRVIYAIWLTRLTKRRNELISKIKQESIK